MLCCVFQHKRKGSIMNGEMQDDPLGKLFDTTSVQDQRELLADTVYPYARIDGETLEVHFTEEGEALTSREKILVFLLMRKALFMRNIVSKEAMGPSEIEKGLMTIPGGTLRPLLRKLVDERLVRTDKGEDGGYYVPGNRIKEINALLSKKGAKS